VARVAFFALLLLIALVPASAQTPVAPCVSIPATSTTPALGCNPVTATNPLPVTPSAPSGTQNVLPVPSSLSAAGIAPVASASAVNNLLLKATPGNLYSVYATNLTNTAGFLIVLNATSAPGDGAVAPLDCVEIPGNSTASINYGVGPPAVYGTGIVAVLTSANTCFTKTTGVITGFIKGAVQ